MASVNNKAVQIALVVLIALLLCVLGALVALSLKGRPQAEPAVNKADTGELESIALPYSPIAYELYSARVAENPTLSAERQLVVDSALSLVGKVEYFWGGKSFCIGNDPLWGQLALVESQGSESTGTTRPFGLDCSGYVSWCFIQNGLSFEEMVELIGNGSTNQWDRTHAIKWRELLPGDLVFQYSPADDKGNHVGIVVGFTEDGEPLIAHSGYTWNGVIVSGRGEIFRIPRRPDYYND